ALTLFRSISNQVGEADTLDSLGYASEHVGDTDRAASYYRESLALWADLGDRYNEADLLVRLGDLYLNSGKPEEAREVWQQARAILEELNHPDVDGISEKLAGLGSARSTRADVST